MNDVRMFFWSRCRVHIIAYTILATGWQVLHVLPLCFWKNAVHTRVCQEKVTRDPLYAAYIYGTTGPFIFKQRQNERQPVRPSLQEWRAAPLLFSICIRIHENDTLALLTTSTIAAGYGMAHAQNHD
jgi:hypothetical protein